MEPTQEQSVLPTPIENIETQESPTEETEPIKDVKTFWERLDEVLNQNNQMKERMNELIEQFPETEQINQRYRSAIFQPERIVISSNNSPDSVAISNKELDPDTGHEVGELFNSFRCRLQRALVNVKSIQLLSATIPNAVQNIPDNQTIFFYYRIPTLQLFSAPWNIATNYEASEVVTYNGRYYVAGAPNIGVQPGTDEEIWWDNGVDGTRPNYYTIYAIPEATIQVVILLPTFGYAPEYLAPGNQNVFNRTFQDYGDLVTTLNACANGVVSASVPGDIEFTYNPTLNKIQMEGLDGDYYYLPCGYNDPNIVTYMQNTNSDAFWTNQQPLLNPYDMWTRGYTLNLRLGFTWNGNIPLIDDSNGTWDIEDAVWNYLRPTDPIYVPLYTYQQDILTFNSYPDLVNTSCVRIFCDAVQGSTEDSNDDVGLLSIVPINTTNLGVGFYQNNFNNALTKVPKIITEIGISMLNDQNQPFKIPNSAVVLLELAIEYY
jgi:hypothetical protein